MYICQFSSAASSSFEWICVIKSKANNAALHCLQGGLLNHVSDSRLSASGYFPSGIACTKRFISEVLKCQSIHWSVSLRGIKEMKLAIRCHLCSKFTCVLWPHFWILLLLFFLLHFFVVLQGAHRLIEIPNMLQLVFLIWQKKRGRWAPAEQWTMLWWKKGPERTDGRQQKCKDSVGRGLRIPPKTGFHICHLLSLNLKRQPFPLYREGWLFTAAQAETHKESTTPPLCLQQQN